MKVKRIGNILFLAMISVSFAYAQQDSVRIRNHETLGLPRIDSLMMDKNDHSIWEIQKDFGSIHDPSLNLSYTEPAYTFPAPPKKKTIFNSSYTPFIVPAAFISYGLIAQKNKPLKKLDQSTHKEVTEHWQGQFPIDDYMQYASYTAIYALDFCGVKARHNFRDRTIILASSYLIMSSAVQGMKKGFGVERPDGSSYTSFPSGHTATAFLGAHILFREYKDVSPWIGIAGYASAASVGTMRVINKKHWVSDVVTGAGIGILSAEIGYLLLPVFHSIFGMTDSRKNLVIVPVASKDTYGVGLACTF